MVEDYPKKTMSEDKINDWGWLGEPNKTITLNDCFKP